MTPDPPLTMTIPSDLCRMTEVREFVLKTCHEVGLDPDAAQGLALAVHEAIGNVIRHAHRDRPESPLEVHCYGFSDRVEVHILDEGDPFDVHAVPDLDPTELRVGGRGVFLMRKLTDEMTCSPRGDRGNVLRLVKRHSPQAPPAGGD
jgi:serine/threonine-protein kinase RsbW